MFTEKKPLFLILILCNNSNIVNMSLWVHIIFLLQNSEFRTDNTLTVITSSYFSQAKILAVSNKQILGAWL